MFGGWDDEEVTFTPKKERPIYVPLHVVEEHVIESEGPQLSELVKKVSKQSHSGRCILSVAFAVQVTLVSHCASPPPILSSTPPPFHSPCRSQQMTWKTSCGRVRC